MNFMLIYSSTSKADISESFIDDLLITSRNLNRRNNITGVLILRQNFFLQLLEGPEESVRECYERIKKDTRHYNVTIRGEAFTEYRNVPNWSMGLINVGTNANSTENILDLLKSLSIDHYEYQANPESLMDMLWKYSKGAVPIVSSESAKLAHELRTPLTSMLIRTQLLHKSLELALTHTSALQTSMNFQKNIIDNMFLLGLNEEPVAVQLSDMVNELKNVFQPIADQKQFNLTFEIKLNHPVMLRKTSILHILTNLISNALKYCIKNVVTTISTNSHWLQFIVSDDGPGISDEMLPHVFDPFVKEPNSQGSGLGLAVARTLTFHLGGTIEASNHANSQLCVKLPLGLVVT